MPTTIYALIDPRTSEIRYVGKTSGAVESRLSQHLSRQNLKPKRHSSRWLSGLSAEGLKPEIRILEVVEGDWQAAERRWIAHFRAAGVNLTNLTDGGEGVGGWKMSQEMRQAMSARFKGRQFDEEWRRKLSESGKGRRMPRPSSEVKERRLESFNRFHEERLRRKTHCAKGHELAGDNLIQPKPTRKICRTCQRESARLKYLKTRPPLKTAEEAHKNRCEAASRPEVKEARRAGMRKRWQDPAFRAQNTPRMAEISKLAIPAMKRGEDHPNRKLTWAKVDDIRRRVAAGESRRLVGIDHGVALTTVDQIIQGRCWDPATRPAA